MAAADLLGTMLDRHPRNVARAMAEWERRLRPDIEFFQHNGIQQRAFFVPATTFQLTMRRVMAMGMRMPVASSLLQRLRARSNADRLKEKDIARA